MPTRRCRCRCRCCKAHHAQDRKRASETYVERRMAGLCGRCGKWPSVKGRRLCTRCLNYFKGRKGEKSPTVGGIPDSGSVEAGCER